MDRWLKIRVFGQEGCRALEQKEGSKGRLHWNTRNSGHVINLQFIHFTFVVPVRSLHLCLGKGFPFDLGKGAKWGNPTKIRIGVVKDRGRKVPKKEGRLHLA